LKLADYTYVLELGQVVLEGKSEDIMNNPIVKKAYLGATESS
jgi:branched-chain amino acid transport system ATP-binding protein